MNPYGAFSSRKTSWPVLLCLYNLPPWLCMKRKYMLMPLVISGPKQPGNDIDVYLAPLLEDMDKLWRDGVQVWDASLKETFTLRAMIFCTINDFPAYGNLSGFKIKGAKACPTCGDETCSLWLTNCKKTVYMGHRRHLRLTHPYRRKKKAFNGKIELERAPKPLTGKEVYDAVKDLQVQFGKGGKEKPISGMWKKRSIFWDLPYWPHLAVRHCLDVMHVVKNVGENVMEMLNVYGKSKDGINTRKDMIEMGIRLELAPQEGGKRTYLPPACYTLSKREKLSLLECLKSVKVPSGYSSSFSQKVSMKDLKLMGMKSHDFHVLMTQLLPVAIRGILPPPVRHSITNLCFFLNSICSKVLDPEKLDDLQADFVVTLCELEMYFPPSFFDIMVHLTVHLVREIKLCGPVFLRYMYPFERAMGQMKRLVRSRSRPEGSIVEGYVAEEVIEFYTDYLEGVEPVGLPRSRHEGRLQGAGTIGYKVIRPNHDLRQRAHMKILQDLADVGPYVMDHLAEIRRHNPGRNESWIANEHNLNFIKWFENRVKSSQSNTVNETCKWLSYGPGTRVHTYQGYDINGFCWYTRQQDGKSRNQNSGVTLEALTGPDNTPMSYYGWIQEIWELDYVKFRIPLFLCKWVENRRGVRRDKEGFTLVDFSRLGYQDDPFILAKQAKQVFYVADPADKNWHVVLPGKRRIVGIGEVVDEEDYDHFDEIPPFSTGIDPVTMDDNQDAIYLRSDHQEGQWVDVPEKRNRAPK